MIDLLVIRKVLSNTMYCPSAECFVVQKMPLTMCALYWLGKQARSLGGGDWCDDRAHLG